MKKLMLILLVGFLFYGCNLGEVGEPRAVSIERDVVEPPVPVLYYSQFGARGCGTVCDFNAIVATHHAANRSGAMVRADPGMTFRIGATVKSAIIQTDVDWTGATFIIDDREVEQRGVHWADSWLFIVEPDPAQRPFPIFSISGARRYQPVLPIVLDQRSLVVIQDTTTRVYRRQGDNEGDGSPMTDFIIVETDGTVYPGAPIIWDFHNITSVMVHPIGERTLTIRGGHFIRYANRGHYTQAYMHRGINVRRSNVVIDGLFHEIRGQEELPVIHSRGMLFINNAAEITVKNTTLTGRRNNGHIGTYDVTTDNAVNVRFINMRQTNDINSNRYWGITALSNVKNVLLDNVHWSRYNSHTGAYNTTIRNSQFGWQGILIIGGGNLVVENTTNHTGGGFINLRTDLGGSWDGDVFVRNSRGGNTLVAGGAVAGWDFGYATRMPRNVFIDNFQPHGGGAISAVSHNRVPLEGELFPHLLTERVFYRNMAGAVNIPANIAPFVERNPPGPPPYWNPPPGWECWFD